jgi:C_GCAxxG_C_C family probable redox protein
MSAKEALNKFRSGYSCSQSVFSSYSEKVGISKNDALKVSSGFGAGMGELQRTCGAVTGAFMLIGCIYCDPEDIESKQKVKEYIMEFHRKFEKKFGSSRCRELLDCDISTEQGLEDFKNNDLKEKKCVKYVEEACKLIEDILKKLDS